MLSWLLLTPVGGSPLPPELRGDPEEEEKDSLSLQEMVGFFFTGLYIRIDRKLNRAHLPSLLDVFQQLLLPLCICAHTSDNPWAETVPS